MWFIDTLGRDYSGRYLYFYNFYYKYYKYLQFYTTFISQFLYDITDFTQYL